MSHLKNLAAVVLCSPLPAPLRHRRRGCGHVNTEDRPVRLRRRRCVGVVRRAPREQASGSTSPARTAQRHARRTVGLPCELASARKI